MVYNPPKRYTPPPLWMFLTSSLNNLLLFWAYLSHINWDADVVRSKAGLPISKLQLLQFYKLHLVTFVKAPFLFWPNYFQSKNCQVQLSPSPIHNWLSSALFCIPSVHPQTPPPLLKFYTLTVRGKSRLRDTITQT